MASTVLYVLKRYLYSLARCTYPCAITQLVLRVTHCVPAPTVYTATGKLFVQHDTQVLVVSGK